MQAVSDTYTKVSKETAFRVANQLKDRLAKRGIVAEFELQGSVPLDVHIKGVSDVDLLTLASELFSYDVKGFKALHGKYCNPAKRTALEVLIELRGHVETDLADAFSAAKVDKTGAKAVKISGGSLARDVDVVPAVWFDTAQYQLTGLASDRGTKILDKKASKTIENQPFRHIELIGARCDKIGGGLRKAIRLCKNIKADSDRNITLPSFDIASTMYHADMKALRLGSFYELSILAETQRHLDYLACNHGVAKTLYVPDGSRLIFDTNEKLRSLNDLSRDMDELLDAVYAEHTPAYLAQYLMSDKRQAISKLAA
ncbi:hypothetical protein AT984_08000 [Paucibacter sp. KCTC 42545]|nr:hypothetical protein AT984_08000 [Paucibacter sp. KCTC 42545]